MGHSTLVVFQLVHLVDATHGRCSAGHIIGLLGRHIHAWISFQGSEVGRRARVVSVVQRVHPGLQLGVVMSG